MISLYMLIAARTAGLGNRLKCIAGCLFLDDSNCMVNWSEIPTVFPRKAGEYSDLFIFPPEIKKPFPPKARIRNDCKLPVLIKDMPLIKHLKTGVDMQYYKIPKELRKRYHVAFQKIIFSEKIQTAVNDFSKQFDSNTISVHIRTWWMDKPERQNLYNNVGLNSYIDQIKKFDTGTNKFFVSSDNQDVYEQLTKIYGDRLLYTPGEKKTYYEDLIDLILLSKNNVIIGSRMSVFTEVSWWLSGPNTKIIIV